MDADPDRLSQALLEQAAQLASLSKRATEGEVERTDVDRVIADLREAQCAGFGPRPRARRGEGAKWAILAYLKESPGTDVPGDSIAAVAGIGAWARRVRELRTEHGYDIPEIADGVYRLESVVPQEGVAARWRVANGIRRRSGSGRERVLAFLMECVGEVVTNDQILYVARIKTAARRVRELRDEAGWPINSHIDEEGLRAGQYRLLSIDPKDRRDPLQRLYTEELRAAVFQRDDYRCRTCGRNRDEALMAGDSRFYLEIHREVALAADLDRLSRGTSTGWTTS